MAEYEVVREVQNLCGNNQMRDVFFAEIETNDPVSWVRGFLKGKDVELTVDEKENGESDRLCRLRRRQPEISHDEDLSFPRQPC